MLILDTDHISVMQRTSDAAERLQRRLLLSRDNPVMTAITLEEQSRGWITQLGRLSADVSLQTRCYDRIVEMFAFLGHWHVLTFSQAAATEFKRLGQALFHQNPT